MIMPTIEGMFLEIRQELAQMSKFYGMWPRIQEDIGELNKGVALLNLSYDKICKDLDRGWEHFARLDDDTQELDKRVVVLEQQAGEQKGRWQLIVSAVMTAINIVIASILASIGLGRS